MDLGLKSAYKQVMDLCKTKVGPAGYVDRDKTFAAAAKPIKAELTVLAEGKLPDGTVCQAEGMLEVTLNPDKDGFDDQKMTAVKEKKK